jgi:hypothetical protein
LDSSDECDVFPLIAENVPTPFDRQSTTIGGESDEDPSFVVTPSRGVTDRA